MITHPTPFPIKVEEMTVCIPFFFEILSLRSAEGVAVIFANILVSTSLEGWQGTVSKRSVSPCHSDNVASLRSSDICTLFFFLKQTLM